MNGFAYSSITIATFLVAYVIMYRVHSLPAYVPPSPPYVATTAPLDIVKKVGMDRIKLIKNESGLLQPYNEAAMQICESHVPDTKDYSQLALTYFLTPNNTIGSLPLSKLATPEKTLLLQFEQGILGWYWGYLTFEKPICNVMFYVIRMDVGNPELREKYNLPLGATTMYSLSVGVGHGPNTWQYSPHIITDGVYQARSETEFVFTSAGDWGSLSFQGKEANFDLTFDIKSSFNKKQSFGCQCSLSQGSIGPSFNGPNGCLPCFGGAGSLYWSYTQLNASVQRLSINKKELLTAPITGGDGWIDRQWIRNGAMDPLFPRLVNNVAGLINTRSGTIGRYVWINLHLRNPEIQYMIIGMVDEHLKITSDLTFDTKYQIYTDGKVLNKFGQMKTLSTTTVKNSGKGVIVYPTKVSVDVEAPDGSKKTYILDAAPYGDCVTIDFSGNLHWSGSASLSVPGTAFMEFNQFQNVEDYTDTIVDLAGLPEKTGPVFLKPLTFWQKLPSGLMLALIPAMFIALIVVVILGFVKK